MFLFCSILSPSLSKNDVAASGCLRDVKPL